MKIVASFFIAGLFCLSLAFTACNNSRQENPEKKIAASIQANSDSVSLVSKDSIVNKTPVTSSASVASTKETNCLACPVHHKVKGVKGDTCSKCGRDLEKIKQENHSEQDVLNESDVLSQ